jgi:anti-anti-sigma factor
MSFPTRRKARRSGFRPRQAGTAQDPRNGDPVGPTSALDGSAWNPRPAIRPRCGSTPVTLVTTAPAGPTCCDRSRGLDVDVGHLGRAAILRLAGHLDESTTGLLAATLDELLGADVAVVVVDLLDVCSVQDAAVGVFVEATTGARRRGAVLRILADARSVLDVLQSRGSALAVSDLSGRS